MPNQPSPVRARFCVGDPVLLTYIKGHRKVVVPVVVSRVGIWMCEDPESGEETGVEVLAYLVSSGRGGGLRVAPSELRPDTDLDRIVVALDAAD